MRTRRRRTVRHSGGGSFPPPTPPDAPVATAATNNSEEGFSANWNASSGSTSYRLDVASDSGFSSLIVDNQNVGNVTTAAVLGLSPVSTYYYRVRAVSDDGTSDDSNTITALTTPEAPATDAATDVTTDSFSSNWGASSGATGYRLDVSTVADFSTFVSGFNNLDVGNVTTYSVTGLASATTYYYRVRAVNDAGASVSGDVSSVTTDAGGGAGVHFTDVDAVTRFTDVDGTTLFIDV
jgi:hypothetical protein